MARVRVAGAVLAVLKNNIAGVSELRSRNISLEVCKLDYFGEILPVFFRDR